MTLSDDTKDFGLAGALGSAPVWAPSLGEINQILTTVTLALGILIAIGRIWLFLRKRGRSES